MKVKSVTIRGIHNVDCVKYDFKDLNYLYGRNGAGKTTVLQAIQLGLLGYIPGLNKTKQAIFRHSNCPTMSITLELDDYGNAVEINRFWIGGKSSITSKVEIDPENYDIESIVGDIELPVFNFNEFVGMTANKLKDWFIDFLPKSDFAIDWQKELEECIGDKLTERIKGIVAFNLSKIETCEYRGIEQIRWANNWFKESLSYKKDELDRLVSTIQSLVYYDDISGDGDSKDRIDEIESQIIELKAEEQRRKDYEDHVKFNENLEFLIGKHNCNYDSYKDDPRFNEYNMVHRTVEDKLKKCMETSYSEEIEELENSIFDLKGDIANKEKIASGDGVCPYTERICNSIQDMANKCKEELGELESNLSKLKNKLSDLKAKENDLNISIRSYNTTLEDVKLKNRKLIEEYDEIEYLKNKMIELPKDIPEDKEYSKLIDDLMDLKSKYEMNSKYDDMIEGLTKAKFEAENEVGCYKDWVKLTGVNGLQTKMSGCNPFEGISALMNYRIKQLFGEGYQCHFVVEEKANSFSFGLLRGRYVPYDLLSSGEKCMFSLALMMSIVDNASSPLKMVLVDDLFDHLDDENVKNMFESLRNVNDIQMIFAGVKKTNTDFEKEYVIEVGGK